MPELPQTPEGATLQEHTRGGRTGYLVVDGRMHADENPIHHVGPGICPRCDTPAAPWEPPVSDPKYTARIQALKEILHLSTDLEAHVEHLKRAGGYIHTCVRCGLPYFVPIPVARVKE